MGTVLRHQGNLAGKRDDAAAAGAILSAISMQLPSLTVEEKAGGVRFRWSEGSCFLPARCILKTKGGSRERTKLLAQGGSFLDLTGGILHLEGKGVYVHVSAAVPRLAPTVTECAILAVLCEQQLGEDQWVLPPKDALLGRYIDSVSGVRVTRMSLNRILKTLRALGVVRGSPRRSVLDVRSGLEVLAREFYLDRLGASLRFAIHDNDQVRDLMAAVQPLCLWGLADALRGVGGLLEQPDIIASRDALPVLRKRLGPPVKRAATGRVVLVRVANRTPLGLLSDRNEPRRLKPLLAGAAATKLAGPMSTLGKELWRRATSTD